MGTDDAEPTQSGGYTAVKGITGAGIERELPGVEDDVGSGEAIVVAASVVLLAGLRQIQLYCASSAATAPAETEPRATPTASDAQRGRPWRPKLEFGPLQSRL